MNKHDPAQTPARPEANPLRVTRRSLFGLAGASAAIAAIPVAARTFGSGFTHSVASGEPQADSVLLWTRFVGDSATRLEWQVSETLDFARIVAEGETTASPDRDWCAKATATGLTPGRWYYYRFTAPGGAQSPIGRTRTLPEGRIDRFKLAVFSCSNLGFGWFNAYGHAAEIDDCDLAVHLGDYIYEYGAGTYPSAPQRNPDRTIAPDTEIVTLADYRLRYATYRVDPDLQRLHQILPMISVWDDHEITNDAWKDGAENHQSETEGEWPARKAIAARVYREWLPVSDAPWAAYQVGDLATLFRLETRLEGREEQFDLEQVLAGIEDPAAAMTALETFRDGKWADSGRQLLGAAQEQWLASGLKASTAQQTTWQVLVQQVLMGKLKTPAGLLEQIGSAAPEFVRGRLLAAAMASRAGLPLNMDAWDGYPAARERVFKAALEAEANLVVLAGDTHNAWAFELAQDGAKVGVEFGVEGVTSPGAESYLSAVPPATFAQAVVAENAELAWADTSQRGYMTVELTRARATTEFRFSAGIKARSTQLASTKRISTEVGSGTLEV
jgi:alkaline phosphatase D